MSGPALIAASRAWSQRALWRQARALAAWLRRGGLRAGQVVLAPDRPAVAAVLMQQALARLDAALLPYRADPGAPTAPLADLAARCGAEWSWEPHPRALRRLGDGPGASAVSDLALLVKTSGSGGESKLVMLSRTALHASASAVNARLELMPGDRWLACLRFSHIGALAITERCAAAGAGLEVLDGFDARQVGERLAQGAITHVSLVPPMLDRLLALGIPCPPRLRVVLIGGQATSSSLARRALDAGWPLYLTYGMTETASQIATSQRLRDPPPPGHIGRCLPGIELRCAAWTQAPERIRVRGPMLMSGYANPQRRPGEGLADGWLIAADLGQCGPHGELIVQGRADAVAVIGGTNVSLAQVEEILHDAPGLREVAVIAVPEPVWGHRLIVFFRGDLTPDALARWSETVLRGPQRPRLFRAVDEFPRLPSGKIDRVRLRADAI